MIISQATQDFIRDHANDDPRRLALKGTKNPEVDLNVALQQIAGLQTARQKLPSWAATEGIVYPPHLSMEQCSSEQTSRYKAQLLHQAPSTQIHPQSTLLDLTGGFGVDFSFMAQGFAQAFYVEQQPTLCDIARHNFPLLGLVSAQVVCGDGMDFLRQTKQHFDWIYIDPARRDAQGGRTYGISDCTPNVLDMLDLLKEKADHILLKLSPMLDWRKAIQDLGEDLVSEVHIVSVGNECKELLVVLEVGGRNLAIREYLVNCVNLQPNGTAETFVIGRNNSPTPHLLPSTSHLSPLTTKYLYEPNASIMKAGCFAELCERYGVSQVAQNSHLFIFADFIEKFPGRKFQIEAVLTMNKRELKEKLRGLSQANITVRNFPMTVAELRKRLKLTDGGDTYIFATTLADETHVLFVCHRV